MPYDAETGAPLLCPTFNAAQFTPPPAGRSTWTQDASTLGLKPCDWPLHFNTDLGNGKPMQLVDIDECDGRIYRQHGTDVRVLIFND